MAQKVNQTAHKLADSGVAAYKKMVSPPAPVAWSSDLFDCCSNPKLAFLGCICPGYLNGRVVDHLHGGGVKGPMWSYTCCCYATLGYNLSAACCGSSAGKRSELRKKYNLRADRGGALYHAEQHAGRVKLRQMCSVPNVVKITQVHMLPAYSGCSIPVSQRQGTQTAAAQPYLELVYNLTFAAMLELLP
jgi:Cys-rich protein (TIGR01571 family)